MSEPITMTELLAEMERASRTAAEGQTASELLASMGISRARLRAMLMAGVANGTVKAGRAPRPAMDGTMRPVPVYRIVKKPGKVRAS